MKQLITLVTMTISVLFISGCNNAATNSSVPGPVIATPSIPATNSSIVPVNPNPPLAGVPQLPGNRIKKLAFLRTTTDHTKTDLYIVNPDGSELTRIASSVPNYFAWSPDGNQIAFGSDPPKFDFNHGILNVVTIDGLIQKQLPIKIAGSWVIPFWLPDGTRIAYLSSGNKVVIVNVDGSGSVDLEYGRGNTLFQSTNPFFAPNGLQVVFQEYFVEKDRTQHPEIFVSNFDGSQHMRITNSPPDSGSINPVWSPDSKHIAFIDPSTQLSIISPDGSGQMQLTHDPDIYIGIDTIDWSPDSKRIAYLANRRRPDKGPLTEFDVVNIDGSGQMRLIDDMGSNFDVSLTWSPDGNKIAFELLQDGNFQIYIINSDGTGLKRVTNSSFHDTLPQWQP